MFHNTMCFIVFCWLVVWVGFFGFFFFFFFKGTHIQRLQTECRIVIFRGLTALAY